MRSCGRGSVCQRELRTALRPSPSARNMIAFTLPTHAHVQLSEFPAGQSADGDHGWQPLPRRGHEACPERHAHEGACVELAQGRQSASSRLALVVARCRAPQPGWRLLCACYSNVASPGQSSTTQEVTICYGMTETSPVSFQTSIDGGREYGEERGEHALPSGHTVHLEGPDSHYKLLESLTLCTYSHADTLEKRVSTVGRIHPHLEAKFVDPATNEIVPRGHVGELCVKGGRWLEG